MEDLQKATKLVGKAFAARLPVHAVKGLIVWDYSHLLERANGSEADVLRSFPHLWWCCLAVRLASEPDVVAVELAVVVEAGVKGTGFAWEWM